MRVAIVPAAELSAAQLAALQARVDAPEHAHDRGACLFWGREGVLPKLFVAVQCDTGAPIGIAHVDGPLHHVHPAWWLDAAWRGQGVGAHMIDALAAMLKAAGYTGVGRIAIDSFGGDYDAASVSLAQRLAAHFARDGSSCL
jgi:RimJ/RimL family protein N-acetyltransferase